MPQSETAGPKIVPGEGGSLVPVRQSLPALVAASLREQIRRGRWRDWLPGERRLSEELRVSRGTVRAALGILAREQVVRGVSSRGHRVLPRRRLGTAATRAPVIGLLAPEPLETRRPYFASLVAHLREAAAARGWSLQRHAGASYFGAQAEAHLTRLTAQAGCSAWVLFQSTPAVQAWFRARRLPTVVSGHPYPGVDVPSLDVDQRAAGRHAGLLLARRGHRHVALLTSRKRLPGLVEGEAGFETGFRAGASGAASLTRVPCDPDPAALAVAVTRCLTGRLRPTAVVVETPNQYLTVFSVAAALSLAVPRDLSLVSRLDDPFLAHLRPEPARYRADPAIVAKALMTVLARLATGEPVPHGGRKIVPEFLAGGSLAGPAPLAGQR
jgi:LacI family transcriptional regulator